MEMRYKPCPFCGSTDIAHDKCTQRVRCRNCRATSGMISKWFNMGFTETESAVMAWNTRWNDADDGTIRER